VVIPVTLNIKPEFSKKHKLASRKLRMKREGNKNISLSGEKSGLNGF
jgi:hypothetical protein